MSEQITPDQLGEHLGREVEMTMRGRIVDAASPCIVNAAAGGNWYPSTLRAMEITITLLPAPVPDEPTGLGAVVEVVIPDVSYPTHYVRRCEQTENDDAAPWVNLTSLVDNDWRGVVHGYGTPVEVTVIHPGVEVPRG